MVDLHFRTGKGSLTTCVVFGKGWSAVMDLLKLKEVASATIDANSKELNVLSNAIWENPELNYEEYKAHSLLTSYLEDHGFTVQRSYGGLETAFRATLGSGRPNICLICEFDALPDIGHACGHNLIAEACVSAGLGLVSVLNSPSPPTISGTITVLGTPAEEGGGGKILLLKSGAFDDLDLVMMAHPGPSSVIRPLFNAVKELEVIYKGRAAHAAAYPWEGVNALDAAVMGYNFISVLRQQIKTSWRVHLVIVRGGVKPNIIPEETMLSCYIKAPNVEDLCVLEDKVTACFKSASSATSCRVSIRVTNYVHRDILHNSVLGERFSDNYKSLGAVFDDVSEMYGSTDMIRVSRVVPTLYPFYAVGSGEVNHSEQFAGVCNTPEAHARTLLVGKAMAHTCLDVLMKKELLEEIRSEFEGETLTAS